jgi:hypothetical protein
MEVEFLSNMRYSLYTSEAEWRDWHVKLGRFWSYFDRASKADIVPRPIQTGTPVTPTLNIPPSLPSPPSSTHTSPPFTTTYSPSNSIPNPLPIPSQLPTAVPSPVVSMPPVDLRPTPRKRSYDDSIQEPPAKRVTRSMAQKYSASTGFPVGPTEFSSTPRPASSMPRLPTPNLSISTSSANGYGVPSFAQLPPPGGRAMSLAFPGPMSWSQPAAMPSTSAPSQQSTHNITLTPFGQQSRQQILNPTSSPITSSPTSSGFSGQGSSPSHLSPSFFLTNRNSPYRPVRRVSTLLVPPPPASFNSAPHGLGFNQMHYQPLGKSKSECKTGVVPYMQADSWPQIQSSQWPPLPPPNFHA